MRRIVLLLPLMVLGLATQHRFVSAPALPHHLIAYDCANCARHVLSQTASLDECQRSAYAMNDGADVFVSIHPRHARKLECRPVH